MVMTLQEQNRMVSKLSYTLLDNYYPPEGAALEIFKK